MNGAVSTSTLLYSSKGRFSQLSLGIEVYVSCCPYVYVCLAGSGVAASYALRGREVAGG